MVGGDETKIRQCLSLRPPFRKVVHFDPAACVMPPFTPSFYRCLLSPFALLFAHPSGYSVSSTAVPDFRPPPDARSPVLDSATSFLFCFVQVALSREIVLLVISCFNIPLWRQSRMPTPPIDSQKFRPLERADAASLWASPLSVRFPSIRVVLLEVCGFATAAVRPAC